jgi:phosphate transport system permease protein
MTLSGRSGRKAARSLADRLLLVTFVGSALIGLGGLAVLLVDALEDGLPWLTWDFLNNFASRFPAQAGIKAALFGSLWIVGLTAAVAVPLGVAAAVYLEEYAPRNRFTSFIHLNILNLAGVPSIVYGLLGLGLFVQALALGRSILAGALTMGLLVLPIVIIASREAILSVPRAHRLGAYALGATQWQVVRRIVLPEALPGILTGTVLALARAIGEAAPMIAIAALLFITYLPTSPLDRFTVIPIQIFNWISRPQVDFHGIAAAGILVLLAVLLGMNSVAIFLRNRYQKRVVE